MPNAKDDGKEASKVPQKLSRHLEECQNVEKVPKTVKCTVCFVSFSNDVIMQNIELRINQKKYQVRKIPDQKNSEISNSHYVLEKQ